MEDRIVNLVRDFRQCNYVVKPPYVYFWICVDIASGKIYSDTESSNNIYSYSVEELRDMGDYCTVNQRLHYCRVDFKNIVRIRMSCINTEIISVEISDLNSIEIDKSIKFRFWRNGGNINMFRRL